MSETGRMILQPGDILELETEDFAGTCYRRRIQITGLSPKGMGSTSIAYEGVEEQGSGHKRKVIVKEFYPSWAGDVSREGTMLRFGPQEQADERYERDRERFARCWRMQEKLSGSDAMEIMVRSLGFARYGDSLYMISEMHRGDSLRTDEPRSMPQILRVMILTCEMMDILHANGYLFVDFCPENLLWIKKPEAVRLFDADSLLEESRIAEAGPEEVWHHEAYDSPQMETLRMCSTSEFAQKKKNYLDRSADVYKLGVLFFQLLFGRLPSQEEKEPGEKARAALLAALKRSGKLSGQGGAKEGEEILRILGKFLCTGRMERYRGAKEAMDDLIRLQGRLQAQPYLPKRSTAGANAQMAFYRMLEAHPLYSYSRTEGETRILEMAVAGSRAMREQLLTIVISCAQMLHSQLRIHLVSDDAEEFWKAFSDRKARPALAQAVQVITGTGTEEAPFDGGGLVDTPLAYIRLLPGGLGTLQELAGAGCRYFVVLQDEKESEGTVRALRTQLKGTASVICYLKEGASETAAKGGRPALFPIPRKKLTADYNEKELRGRIDRMGRLIQAYYTKTWDPFANAERIEKEYVTDPYSRDSSRRSAMSIFYKMASVPGLDPGKPDAGQKFYEQVIGGTAGGAAPGKLFSELEALEHRSWTAYMILTGARGVTSAEQLRSYLFVGDNDWKQKADDGSGRVLRHPCLSASRPERNLPETGWDFLTGKSRLRLDPLESATLMIYEELQALTDRLQPELTMKLDELKRIAVASGREDLAAAVRALGDAKEKCANRDTDAGPQWRSARAAAGALCQGSPDAERLGSLLKQVDRLMRPLLAYAQFHDFKENDAAIIRAIPCLFAAWRGGEGGTIVIKPLSGTLWENLFSTLMIEPSKLILVPEEGTEAEEVRAKCEAFLRKRGLKTEVTTRLPQQLRSLGRAAGRIFIDETGADGRLVRAIARVKCLEGASYCYVKDRVLLPSDGDTGVTLLNRPVRLTVPEVFDLHGADMSSRHSFRAETKLAASQYRSLWNVYRRFRSGKKWKIVIDTLREMEQMKRRRADLTDTGKLLSYRTDLVEEEDLAAAGVTQIITELLARGLLESCQLPEKGEYDVIVYKTKYPQIAEVLDRMVLGVNRSPQAGLDPFCARPKYKMEEGSAGEVVIVNTGLYTVGKVPHAPSEGITGGQALLRDDVMEEFFSLINAQEKDRIGTAAKRTVHLIRQADTGDGSGKIFLFRYYSQAVREALEKEGNILEILIYRECRSRKVFDDIHMNVEFTWSNGSTRNEVDVIGTRNGKTYFISAKMQEPQKSFLEEIEVLARRFGVEGVPVLVCSHYSTAHREGTVGSLLGEIGEGAGSPVERRSSAMHVGWIGIDDIVRTDSAGKETVLIGESLRRLVESMG